MKTHQYDVQRFGVRWLGHLIRVLCLLLLLEAQIALAGTRKEQTTFYADPSEPITRPILVPDAVLQILAKDTAVVSCMKDNPLPHGESLASWFTASEVHLDGSDETGIVVLPISAQGESYMCFRSVEGIEWFWVFTHTGEPFQLVLKSAGLSLSVLDSTHNGYRDIRAEGLVGKLATTITFRFERGRYRQFRKKTTQLH